MGSGSLSTVLTCTEIHTSEGVCICAKQLWAAYMHAQQSASAALLYLLHWYAQASQKLPHTCKVQAEATLWQVGSQ